MNCPKCNAQIIEGSKFCTSCGYKLQPAGTQCPSCGKSIAPGSKFCTSCGFRIISGTPSDKNTITGKQENTQNDKDRQDMEFVNNKVIWNILPGQTARVISESEFEYMDNVDRVIIHEGTTAYIRADGRTIATISGGSYRLAASGETGHWLKKCWKVLMGLFSGNRDNQNGNIRESQQDIIYEYARKNASFSIVILLDKTFPMLIGSREECIDSYKDMSPMTVRMKDIDLEVILNGFFKITDHEEFIRHYLSDKTVLNTAEIAQEMSDTVRSVLQNILYGSDLENGRVPESMYPQIKSEVNNYTGDSFFGVSLVRIVEICTGNEDIERLRALGKELYLSEKELEYLEKTNTFKNRLASVTNSQTLREMSDSNKFAEAVEQLNRDNLLLEADAEKFRAFLVNEQLLSMSKNEAETQNALNEIEKSGILSEEEVEKIRDQVRSDRYRRGAALEMMQLKDSLEFEKVRTEGSGDILKARQKIEMEIRQMHDDYEDSRYDKEIDKARKAERLRLDVMREEEEIQNKMFFDMLSAQERIEENKRRHEAEMELARLKNAEEMERMKWENSKDLSDEKVWALKGGEAATAYAQNKYSAEAERRTREEVEAARREADQRLDAERASRDAEHRQNQEQMFRLMRDMVSMTGSIQSQRAEDTRLREQEKMEEKDRQLREKEERILRQENRMDTAYDRALNYTTRDNLTKEAPAMANARFCPECGAKTEGNDRFCPDCGAEIR